MSLHAALQEACIWGAGVHLTFNVVEPGVSWLLYASIAWCMMLCAAICFSTSARLGPYGSASNCFYKSQHCKTCYLPQLQIFRIISALN